MKLTFNVCIVEWTGFSSSGDCIICHEPDEPTKEYDNGEETFFMCDKCFEIGQKGVKNG
jgi:hypothetical protein